MMIILISHRHVSRVKFKGILSYVIHLLFLIVIFWGFYNFLKESDYAIKR